MAYWRKEPHETAESRHLTVRFYQHRGKLTISQHIGRLHPDAWRTVTIDQRDALLHPGLIDMLRAVLDVWQKGSEKRGGGPGGPTPKVEK